MCDFVLISSIDAASPDIGAYPDADPMPDESISKGVIPSSAQEMAERKAAGPAPIIKTSQDSNAIEAMEEWYSQERDA